ncbi:MAG: VCBS repeat-containing protein, partial [Myxococcaceae bacterium]
FVYDNAPYLTVGLWNGGRTFDLHHFRFSDPNATSFSLVAGDFNSDGIDDIVYVGGGSNPTWNLAIFEGVAGGYPNSWPTPTGAMLAGPNISYVGQFFGAQGAPALKVSDLNADGHLDIAMVTAFSGDDLYIFTGKGNFTFTTNYYGYPALTHGKWDANSLSMADFNGDGYTDIVTTIDNLPGFSMQFNDAPNRPGQFYDTLNYPITPKLGTGSDLRSIGTGDFNRDGVIDLVVPDYAAQRVTIYLGHPK